MPRTNIAETVAVQAGVSTPGVAADTPNGNMFSGGSNVILVARNGGAVTRTVTIVTPATVGGLAIADVGPVNVVAGATMIFGPFPDNIFGQQSGTDVGKVYVDVTHADILLAAVRVP